MAGEQQDRENAQVHWLVAGPFGLGQRGRMLRLVRSDFEEALSGLGLCVRVALPHAVGEGAFLEVELKVDSLKQFTLKHIVGSIPELTTLAAKADEVAKLKDPTIAALSAIVGNGPLIEKMRPLLDSDAAAEGAPADAPQGGARSAISAFVKATSSKTKTKPIGRQLRDLVEEHVWSLAADILRSPEVRELETAWRGLRFLLTECPRDAQMEVMVLETDRAHLVDDLNSRAREEDLGEPDCIFVPIDFDSTEALQEIASYGEQELIPVVVGVGPTVFGAEEAHEVPDAFEAIEHARNEEVPAWAQAWDALRLEESTRWLCAVTNRVVLHSEGSGVAARHVYGSGVWGMATLLAGSYRATGGFARIFGGPGAISAPASHTIQKGSGKDGAAPTEAFYAIGPAEQLAKNGVLGLGSVKNSDRIALVKAPCVRGATDVVPLPAQILTGRVVRFASWVKAQLPEGCDSDTANSIFESAASVFLFPGQEAAAHVRAATTNIDGEAHVVVRAKANPAIASIPFEIAFPLPLGWSVPAPQTASAEPAPAAAPSATPNPTSDESGGIASASVGFDTSIVDDKS